MKEYNVIFAVIAMREVIFFANVADKLKKSGYKTAFITFYEPGDDYLIKRGYDVFSIHKSIRGKKASVSEEAVSKLQEEYRIQNIRQLLLHEKLTFNRLDEEKLLEKTVLYLNFFSDLFEKIKTDYVVQELGGFIAPMTLFHSCLKSNIDHLFIEPAMYKGRLFFTLNDLNYRIRAGEGSDHEVSDYVCRYIKDYNENKTVVAPVKDLHHFRDATLGKLVNKENIKKLLKKLENKYVKSLSEEYDAIGNHVLRFAKMYLNRHLLTKLYSDIDRGENFVYYPFHVPLDFQLTVRSNQYLDQISLLKYIANVLPYGLKLYVKEHPAAIGAYNYKEINELLKNKNVRLIYPSINSYDLISKSKCVITINSKVGVEALFQGKKVIVLGNAFYRGQGLTIDINNISELGPVIKKETVNSSDNKLSINKVMKFFDEVYRNSYPGELYVNDADNLDDFSASLITAMNRKG